MQTHLLPSIARFSTLSGLSRLCRPIYGGLGLILMFHRFTADPAQRIDLSGTVSIQFLDTLLRYIRSVGPDIIRLRDVPEAIEQQRPFVCLTADDGYRDNMEVALPVFRRHEAPVTLFIPSSILDRSINAWWLQIEELARMDQDPAAAYAAMVQEVDSNPDMLDYIRPFFPFYQADLNEQHFLSENDLISLSRDPLVDIGGHTVNHPFLKNLTAENAYHEVAQNKADLENLLDLPVETFAYPYGHARACGTREFSLAQKAGFRVAVTTRDANIHLDHAGYLTALPRYSVRGQYENLEIYDLQRSGAYRALKSKFGSPFVTE